MSFWRDVCKEEIWRLPESPNTQKNLPEFHQQELAALYVTIYAVATAVTCHPPDIRHAVSNATAVTS